MKGWQLLAVVAGVGGLAWYYRAKLPTLLSGAESIYKGAAPAKAAPGSALNAKGKTGPTAGGAHRGLAAGLAERSTSPISATQAGAAAKAATLFARAGDGPNPYSSGTPLFRPPTTPNETALSSNLAAARLFGK